MGLSVVGDSGAVLDSALTRWDGAPSLGTGRLVMKVTRVESRLENPQ